MLSPGCDGPLPTWTAQALAASVLAVMIRTGVERTDPSRA